MATLREQKRYDVTPENELYHAYSVAEDKQRTNVHYEQPPAFFYNITGGEWNVYSCNLWDDATDDTASQAAKLDLAAQLLDLRPGQRILDVGCGWGGPLTYLCKTYGLQGVGLTLSSTQRQAAEERIARYGVDVEIVESHWQEYEAELPFDAIYTDEVIVHFYDLGGFFRKAHALLRPGGRMANKELHFVHPKYQRMTRGGAFVNKIYGSTGNYRTLAEELNLLYDAGFELDAVHEIPRAHYYKTLERWMTNQHEHHDELVDLVGEQYYREFRMYLRLARQVIGNMTLDVVVGRTPLESV